MSNLFTQIQVYDLCLSVGFSAESALIGSAVAMVESAAVANGEPRADADAVGDQELATDYWGYSYGLFMIRSVRSQSGTGQIRDAVRLPDPVFNVRSAKAIFDQYGWGRWTAYTSGQYRAYLQDLYPPPKNVYIVVYGDTLTRIAEKLGMEWEELARINGLHSPYTIHIGQELIIKDEYVPPPFPVGLAPNHSVPSARPLQQSLKTAGFMAADVPESDNYGPKTQDAVAAFHNKYIQFRDTALLRDVRIGPRGWEFLHTLAYGG